MSTVQKDRKQLLESAVSFLSDPSIKNAPLTKKVEFLQTKGLSQEEVEAALRQSQDQSKPENLADNTQWSAVPTRNDYVYEAVPPPLPRRDWKDYFIMASVSAGLIYGVYEFTKRYVVPNILPESKSKLEQDKKEIQDQFSRVDKVLDAIEQEQEAFRVRDQEKLAELDVTLGQLKKCLEYTTRTREKMEDDFRMLKLEMTNLQNSIDKFIIKKDNSAALEKINSELNSLKSLIKNSGFAEGSHGSSAESLGRNKSPIPNNAVPSADSIPSAADILAKLNMNKKDKSIDSNEPAWKKAREESLGSSTYSIPEWQKSPLNQVTVPNWQHTLEQAEEEQEKATETQQSD
ncbi:hypothetical protein HG535_0D01740 [Zygotorulaspora mrakii]|uniref:Peroxisomal membrane protein PEX14 n=1 Tax=Zygotorulaspora mrakii TaxID=42260 RepID=A0A7H9B207_ZYGMR|nr:uncharacterized protein HG535_0D01740 [Zygotorulaspora mrakii]QLG72466.1 hypothetical protein HG535_0D01740 [Zygotorulaspora mrakii]